MIKRISTIQNFGLYSDFNWNRSVRDQSGNVCEFRKMNIFYGRNYSGKTTLSRVVRSLETGRLPLNYELSSFEVETDSGKFSTSTSIDAQLPIRVYNRDFVLENLKFVVDDSQDVESFAILGEGKVRIEARLQENADKLGSIEKQSGLLYRQEQLEKALSEAEGRLSEKKDALETLLGNKANQSIKRNTLLGVITYNIRSLRNDIDSIGDYKRYERLNSETKEFLVALLRETVKTPIGSFSFPMEATNLENLIAETSGLVSKVIRPTKSIERLLADNTLQKWVREGVDIHRGQHSVCQFCGNPISSETWVQLGEHFNEASKALQKDLAQLKKSLEDKKTTVLRIDRNLETRLYADNLESLRQLYKTVEEVNQQKNKIIDLLLAIVKKREDSIFAPLVVPDIPDIVQTTIEIKNQLAEIVRKNDERTGTLSRDQESARLRLRLDEVVAFLTDIGYEETLTKIKELETERENAERSAKDIGGQVAIIRAENSKLILELQDEEKGAAKVGEYLNHYFGHTGITLTAVERQDRPGFIFRVLRGDTPAKNLSEGECSILSFCYFMARLDDVSTKGQKPIIWIDDPISSLDSNHVFYVYSLIEKVITRPRKSATGANEYNYDQLFISTHNLDFLKYLKQLSHPKKEKKADLEYFLIDRKSEITTILPMPSYLRKYTTEFNYLFDQIVKCSKVESPVEEFEVFYNFGNNLRKFLEAYLFYKFPNNSEIIVKMNRFFKGDDAATALTTRVQNELSHLEDIFDRSLRPLEIPEIPNLARFVLNKIKEKDRDQYDALMDSIA